MSERNGAASADNHTKTIGNGEGVTRPHTPLAERERPESTRATYARALRGLDDWLAGRPLDDSSLSAYLDDMYERGFRPSTPASWSPRPPTAPRTTTRRHPPAN